MLYSPTKNAVFNQTNRIQYSLIIIIITKGGLGVLYRIHEYSVYSFQKAMEGFNGFRENLHVKYLTVTDNIFSVMFIIYKSCF